MPNYRTSLDLSKLKGAKILNVTFDGNTMPCVVIPCAYNDMIVTDKEGKTQVTPYLGVNFWGCNDNFIAKCKEIHADKPDYVPPTHHAQVSFSEGFRKRAKAVAEKRILAEKPDISPKDLKIAVSEAVRITLGTLTPLQSQGQRGYQPEGTAKASAVDPMFGGGEAPIDDLPF